jgi:RNA polymerase sigma-70 factor (ECF subfamily)
MSKRSFSSHADLASFWPDRQIRPSKAFSAQSLLTDDILARLYEEFGARMYRYALLLLADHAAAEDVVQDAFVRLAAALRRQSGVEPSFAYLATIVRNECYTALRKRRRRGAGGSPPLLEPAAPDATEEERMILDAALRALPVEQREVIYLKVYEGWTFQEISDRCAAGINTVASRYRYATAALRRALAPAEETVDARRRS